jgi:hypothetical protein
MTTLNSLTCKCDIVRHAKGSGRPDGRVVCTVTCLQNLWNVKYCVAVVMLVGIVKIHFGLVGIVKIHFGLFEPDFQDISRTISCPSLCSFLHVSIPCICSLNVKQEEN